MTASGERSLAKGLLGGRYDVEHPPPPNSRASRLRFSAATFGPVAPLLKAIRSIARDHDATPAQIALAWLIRHSQVVAIPGATSLAQVEANAAAADIDLTDEEAMTISELGAQLSIRENGQMGFRLRARLLGG